MFTNNNCQLDYSFFREMNKTFKQILKIRTSYVFNFWFNFVLI